jgi:hypothetical protein
LNAAPPLRLELRPSPTLAALILVAHASAAACAALVLPGAAGLLLAAALLGLGAASAWSRALLRSGSSIRWIEINPQDITLELAGGGRFSAQAAGRRYVSRWLVLVPLRPPSRRTILVTAGMLGPAAFRRLRLWALWGRVPPVAGVQLST